MSEDTKAKPVTMTDVKAKAEEKKPEPKKQPEKKCLP